jgi:biopolymer transport protein ExbB
MKHVDKLQKIMNLLKAIRLGRGLPAIIVFLILSQAAQASTWWNDAWTIRKQITLDTTATGAAIADPIGTTPVLIRLHTGNFQFDATREDGSDIRFVAEDNSTLLPYHIEKYDALMGEAFVWVKVPDVKPGAKTSFWLYYGNGSPQVNAVSDAKGTYDADTVLVYHFNEHGTPAIDATANGNLSQNAGIPADGSFIGSGIRLDEETTLMIPPSTSLQWPEGSSITISTWIKLTGLPAKEIIFKRSEGDASFVIGAENGVPYIEVSREGNVQRSAAKTPMAEGSWRHLAVVASTGTMTLYLDGENVASLNASLPAMNNPAKSAPLQIGGGTFSGELDEFEISRIARSPGFIKLAALGQGEKGAKLLVLGPDEQAKSWFTGGYLGVILKSLSLDGWIVIGILMIMALISWYVMISKASYLNKVAKGNAEFIKVWHHVSSNLSILIHTDLDHVKTLGGRIDEKSLRTIRRASVYRIYSIGAEELRDRLAKDERLPCLQTGGSKALSARSVQAIRATLDGGLVRETQKLNRQMVLLTIAISGGPFLGLLGTVVGVMITFAAIAQQGEVNVNSIAPGISAALAATVAGLAVAIPALFGYNYLLSRVKDATSDMQVFIDEFVTKMAEFYGGGNEENSLTEALEKH